MSDRLPPVSLRLEPHAIPAVRMAVEEAILQVGTQVTRARYDGVLVKPWLGDEISKETQDFYNSTVMESATGPYAVLLAYQAELFRIRDQLWTMEEHYRRTEGENAELWGRA